MVIETDLRLRVIAAPRERLVLVRLAPASPARSGTSSTKTGATVSACCLAVVAFAGQRDSRSARAWPKSQFVRRSPLRAQVMSTVPFAPWNTKP